MRANVIDIFSGPGGLAEGFASFEKGRAFKIVVSAEMEQSAHKTLVLRSFFRLARLNGDQSALRAYYSYCESADSAHPSQLAGLLWNEAEREARQLTLGEPLSNAYLDKVLSEARLDADQTVLIGGPPCQAYSLVGRARNKGVTGYVAEEDHRHFLYREYLRILAKAKPAVFVMENVKGILSSRVGGRRIFSDILQDLCKPVAAMGRGRGPKYRIYSLSSPCVFHDDMDVDKFDPRDFIVRAEHYGIPQARHRVILLGVREDFAPTSYPLLRPSFESTVRQAIGDLPMLRSRLSKDDDPGKWLDTISKLAQSFALEAEARGDGIGRPLSKAPSSLRPSLPTGGLRMPVRAYAERNNDVLKWTTDRRLNVWLNHEARSHMASDLGRYFYASIFAKLHGHSPKGHKEFALRGLAPAHANWKTGKFADRFRVQVFDAPSTTITSHISKDGHYFIHPDASQCRSLTVREAARLQTFPDNYFFQGNRTQQFHQVGNAVPPMLAAQIASVVQNIISGGAQAALHRANAAAQA